MVHPSAVFFDIERAEMIELGMLTRDPVREGLGYDSRVVFSSLVCCSSCLTRCLF